jgi:hypothetical protein
MSTSAPTGCNNSQNPTPLFQSSQQQQSFPGVLGPRAYQQLLPVGISYTLEVGQERFTSNREAYIYLVPILKPAFDSASQVNI